MFTRTYEKTITSKGFVKTSGYVDLLYVSTFY